MVRILPRSSDVSSFDRRILRVIATMPVPAPTCELVSCRVPSGVR